jgi:hypothetical protein
MALSLDQFGQKLVYENSATVATIGQDMLSLRGFDKVHEKLQTRWGCGGALCLVAGVPTLFTPVFPLGIALIIFGIVSLFVYGYHRKRNLEDRRYETVANLLHLLGRDIGKDTPLQARVDLRKPTEKSKLRSTGTIGIWKVKYYTDPWLHLHGRLLDGTSFSCQMTDLVQVRSAWKRGSSGKSKLKTKEKKWLRTTVRLRVKPKAFPGLKEVAAGAEAAVRMPPGVIVRRFSCGEDELLLKTGTKREWDAKLRSGTDMLSAPETVALAFLSLYQILNLARRA